MDHTTLIGLVVIKEAVIIIICVILNYMQIEIMEYLIAFILLNLSVLLTLSAQYAMKKIIGQDL